LGRSMAPHRYYDKPESYSTRNVISMASSGVFSRLQ
jgi:hypothetical protein